MKRLARQSVEEHHLLRTTSDDHPLDLVEEFNEQPFNKDPSLPTAQSVIDQGDNNHFTQFTVPTILIQHSEAMENIQLPTLMETTFGTNSMGVEVGVQTERSARRSGQKGRGRGRSLASLSNS